MNIWNRMAVTTKFNEVESISIVKSCFTNAGQFQVVIGITNPNYASIEQDHYVESTNIYEILVNQQGIRLKRLT